MKKVLYLAIIGFLAIVISMTSNVVLHEAGHYILAEGYGYNPTMHFNSPINNDTKSLQVDAAVAYVSYGSPTKETTGSDAAIAFAGPLTNLIFGFMFMIFYFTMPKKDGLFALLLLIFAITGFIAGFSNLYPSGSTDGAVILNYLRNV